MKLFMIRVLWDKNGSGYPKADEHRIRATSLRAAVGKALAPEYRKARTGWRESAEATFTIQVAVLGYTATADDLNPKTKEEKTNGV